MKLNYKYLTIFILFCLLCSNVSSASETNNPASDFSVNVLYPENQIGKQLGYFNLRVHPNLKQTLEIEVTNLSKNKNEITMYSQRSTTSDGGVISYKEQKKERHPDNHLDFNDIIHLDNEVIELMPEETKLIKVNLAFPDTKIEGEVLGGIHFHSSKELTKEEKEKTVINKFSYSIPILMRQDDGKIENNLTLKEVKVNHRNFHNFIESVLDNSAPVRVASLKIDGSIFREGQNEPLYSRKEENYKIAPFSTLNYGFDLKDTELIPGDYKLILKVLADGKEYEFEETFKITKKEASKFNEESVYTADKKNIFNLYLIIPIIFLLLIGLLLTIRNNQCNKKKKKLKVKGKRKDTYSEKKRSNN